MSATAEMHLTSLSSPWLRQPELSRLNVKPPARWRNPRRWLWGGEDLGFGPSGTVQQLHVGPFQVSSSGKIWAAQMTRCPTRIVNLIGGSCVCLWLVWTYAFIKVLLSKCSAAESKHPPKYKGTINLLRRPQNDKSERISAMTHHLIKLPDSK